MLTYILALMVIVVSAGLYSATFVLPEVSRKNDLVWSGVGLFYGLVLWVCAGRITGGVLLGQMASVGLIGWLGWQMLEARWNEIPEAERVNQAKIQGLRDRLTGLTQSETAQKLKNQAQGAMSKAQSAVQDLGVPVETGKTASSGSKELGDTVSGMEAATTAEVLKRAEEPLKPEDFGNPPKVAIDMTAAKPAKTSFTQPVPDKNPLGGLFDRAKGLATGLNSPKKNKEIYVRKGKDEPSNAVSPTSPATQTAAGSVEMGDDFDFGDLEETPIVKPTIASISADEMTAVKPTSASISADEMTAVKPTIENATIAETSSDFLASATDAVKTAANTVVEAVTEVVSDEDPGVTISQKSAAIVDEFGDAIEEAVEQRLEDRPSDPS